MNFTWSRFNDALFTVWDLYLEGSDGLMRGVRVKVSVMELKQHGRKLAAQRLREARNLLKAQTKHPR